MVCGGGFGLVHILFSSFIFRLRWLFDSPQKEFNADTHKEKLKSFMLWLAMLACCSPLFYVFMFSTPQVHQQKHHPQISRVDPHSCGSSPPVSPSVNMLLWCLEDVAGQRLCCSLSVSWTWRESSLHSLSPFKDKTQLYKKEQQILCNVFSGVRHKQVFMQVDTTVVLFVDFLYFQSL